MAETIENSGEAGEKETCLPGWHGNCFIHIAYETVIHFRAEEKEAVERRGRREAFLEVYCELEKRL